MPSDARGASARSRRPRQRRDPFGTERCRGRRERLTNGYYGLLLLLMVSVLTTLALVLTGRVPRQPTADGLRAAGLVLMALGFGLQLLLDFVSGSRSGGMLIPFTKTGWRFGAPVWMAGLAAFAVASLVVQG